MKSSLIKKIGLVVGIVASIMIIGTTVSGWVSDYREEHPAEENEAAIVSVLNA